MPNGHWRMATQLRLGMVRLRPGLRCAMPCGRSGGRLCDTPLDEHGLHCMLCKAGPSRLRPHRSVVACLAQHTRRSGAHVDVERVVPELNIWDGARCVDAIMDAVIWWPGRLNRHLTDATIRCPHAKRYATEEDPTERAAREKHHRYGDEVWTLAYTSYGRLGIEGQQFLEVLASEARDASGDFQTQRGLVAVWRRDLERALLHATADCALQALGAKGTQVWEVEADLRVGITNAPSVDLAPEVLGHLALQRMATRTRQSGAAPVEAMCRVSAEGHTRSAPHLSSLGALDTSGEGQNAFA